MAAKGRPGDLVKAQAHYDNAAKQVESLQDSLDMARAHLEDMAVALKEAQARAKPKPVKKKKTAKKKAAKKGG